MNTPVMKWTADASLHPRARMTGLVFLIYVLTAISAELFVRRLEGSVTLECHGLIFSSSRGVRPAGVCAWRWTEVDICRQMSISAGR